MEAEGNGRFPEIEVSKLKSPRSGRRGPAKRESTFRLELSLSADSTAVPISVYGGRGRIRARDERDIRSRDAGRNAERARMLRARITVQP